MLSTEEKKEIDIEISHSYVKQAVGIEALKIVQKYRGWVPDDAVKDLADYLDMPPADLDNTATFYNLIFRKPVGRHIILVCDGIACWMLGAENIASYISKKLGISPGETTADGRFTLIPNSCLGACDRAPAMIIDDVLYTELTPEKADAILEEYK